MGSYLKKQVRTLDSSDVRAIILNGEYQELVAKYRSLSYFDDHSKFKPLNI